MPLSTMLNARQISKLLDQAFENTYLLEYSELDGLGIVSKLIELLRLSRELEFIDEEKLLTTLSISQKEKRKKCHSER